MLPKQSSFQNDKGVPNNLRETDELRRRFYQVFSGGFLQRPAVETSESPNLSTPTARHVGGARLTLPGGRGLGRTIVSGAPGLEEVVGARWRGQQVTRTPIPAAPAAHRDPEGHVRAEASGPPAGTRSAGGLLRPLV